ncbi:alpha/beta hydrolase [Amycolatopsis carbonis]|uniref:Alpha/beta hydrolase n=1 Tax=Amycolatopsis carbonis TaxID=715471 RepID=A0A9Y2IBG1_9PSEU|nr:alpha/beta hydrolase [Amycolatopsis sp. 2-15]WIX76829.1 alpha/beta hydrolase [Amycolatopsis sp. 2-15]
MLKEKNIPAPDLEEARAINKRLRAEKVPDVTTPAGRIEMRTDAIDASKAPESLTPQDVIIPGPGPGGDLRLHVLRPPGDVRAVMVNIHGGGWVIGLPEQDDRINELTVNMCGVATVSVDYRLAPENAYPAQLEDCLAAVEWLLEHAETEFGTDRLVIAGSSAGGHLAAMTLLHLRDELRAIDRVVAASLVFGVYDVSLSIAARLATPDTPVLTAQYLQGTAETVFPIGLKSWHSPRFSPLYADLAGLPPALFTVGSLDPLLDDSLFMSERWKAAGNDAELDIWPEAPHKFFGKVPPVGKHAQARINSWLNARLDA